MILFLESFLTIGMDGFLFIAVPIIELMDIPLLDAFDVVKYLGSEELVYMFRELTINVKWRYKFKLPAKEITVVSFGNDYLNSLLLIL